jgi:large subunit ribosomal protein L6
MNIVYRLKNNKTYESFNKSIYKPFNKIPTIFTGIKDYYNNKFVVYSPFYKVFIIKGIGYQADVINCFDKNNEFNFKKYLFLRVGHSFNMYKSIPNYIGVKVLHKDRKILVYGFDKNIVENFSRSLYKLRKPSVYTGRGIRIKKFNHIRKLGKKDIKKGKI